MGTRQRISMTVALLLALALAFAGPAAASVPDNDDFDDATPITALPFSDAVDTRDATEAADDPDCVGAGPTVWYALTLAEDTFVEVNTFGSDYDTTLSAYLGERGDLEQLRCNDDAGGTLQSRIRFPVAAETTYFIMVGAFDSGPGGNLALNVDTASGIECDAEPIEEHADGVVYEVAPGQQVDCVAFGLDAASAADWRVDFFEADFDDDHDDEDHDFDDFVEFIRAIAEGSEPFASAGESGLTPEGAGTIAFEFTVPDELGFGLHVFWGMATQGEPGAETYLEEFFGLVFEDFEFIEGPMECTPDPVRQGGTVECVVEELTPGDFHWHVGFFTVRELLLSLLLFDDDFVDDPDEDVEDGGPFDEFEPDVQGVGVAGEDGVGTFTFDVPAEGTIEVYLAMAEQEAFFARFAGEVDPAEVKPKPTEVAKPVAPAPPAAKPVVVERPKRVETGAGGAAPAGSQPVALLLAALVLGAGALAVRRRAMKATRRA